MDRYDSQKPHRLRFSMDHGPLASLRVRLLMILALAVIPTVALISYNVQEDRREALRAAEFDALRTAQLASLEQVRWIDDARTMLKAMALHPAVLDHDIAACREYVTALSADNPAYTVIGVISADGQRVCNSLPDPQPPPADPTNQSWFQRVHQNRDFTIGDFQVGGLTGNLVVVFAYPILDTEGQVDRIVNAALNLKWLNQIPVQADLPEGSTFMVVDADGKVLLRYPDHSAYVGQSFADHQGLRAALAGRPGVSRGEGLDGVPRIHGFVPFGPPGTSSLAVRVGIPESEAFAAANAEFRRTLLGLVLASVLALGVAWGGAEALVLRRVQALARATQRVAGGDLSARSGVPHGSGEVGQLARAFDAMTSSLREREADRAAAEAQREQLLLEQAARAAAEQAERQSMAQYLVSRILLDAPDIATAAPRILETIGTYLDRDVGVFWVLEEEEYRILASWSADGWLRGGLQGDLASTATAPAEQVLPPNWDASQTTWTLALAPEAALKRHNIAARDGLQSALLVPVWAGGSVDAVIEMLSSKPLEEDNIAHQPLGVIAGHVGQFMERKQAEDALHQSEERHRTLLENSYDAIALMDQDGIFLYLSPSVRRVIGYEPDQLLGTNAFAIIHPEDLPVAQGALGRTLQTSGGRVEADFRVRHADGSWTWLEVTAANLLDEPSVGGVVVNFRDVTVRKGAQEQMAASLREKEALLREVHHRVKNNLQVVSSLLSLHARRSDDIGVIHTLQDSHTRVRAMALVHERLYSSGDLARIDFGQYLQTLLPELVRLYQRDASVIDVSIEARDVLLDVDVAIPLALMASELVSNALKYAFPPGSGGEIAISAHAPEGPGTALLTVRDTGVGVPQDIIDGHGSHHSSLGLKLVSSLARQLGCSLHWDTGRGTTVNVIEEDRPTHGHDKPLNEARRGSASPDPGGGG